MVEDERSPKRQSLELPDVNELSGQLIVPSEHVSLYTLLREREALMGREAARLSLEAARVAADAANLRAQAENLTQRKPAEQASDTAPLGLEDTLREIDEFDLKLHSKLIRQFQDLYQLDGYAEATNMMHKVETVIVDALQRGDKLILRNKEGKDFEVIIELTSNMKGPS